MLDTLLAPLYATAFHAFGTPTSWAEVAGFVSGALCVWLVVRVDARNWPVGIANALLFLVLFTDAGLYADAGLQVVYAALGLWGWSLWGWSLRGRSLSARPQRQAPAATVQRTSRAEWAGLAVAGLVGAVLLTALLRAVSDSTVPELDALTTVLSLLATWGQAKKRLESWWLWLAADAVYVPLYQYKGLTLTALLYVGFFALCVAGLRAWRREEGRDVRTGAEVVAAA